jgi:hypothetical protein
MTSGSAAPTQAWRSGLESQRRLDLVMTSGLPSAVLMALLIAACGVPLPASHSVTSPGCALTVCPTPAQLLNDTWTWDGNEWHTATVGPSPSPRTLPSIAYDPARGQVVLFGGMTIDEKFLADTWTWDGAGWSIHHPRHSPGPRREAAIVYDPILSKVVLIGGFNNSNCSMLCIGGLDDVWSWDGDDWSPMGHAPALVGSFAPVSAGFDPVSREIVVMSDSMLTWNGAAWTNADRPSQWHAADVMYVSRDTGRLTALAYFDAPGSSLDYKLVHWDGASWAVDRDVSLPDEMHGYLDVAGLTYDESRFQIIAFGGGCNQNRGSETLIYDGSGWSVVEPTHRPTGRDYAQMVFDSSHHQALLFGGQKC